MSNFEIREVKNTWPQYGLQEAYMNYGGEETPYKGILRAGELVSVVKKEYRLVPNEKTVELADAAAQEAGAVPFDQFSGNWFTRVNNHVFSDNDGYKVHALYAFDNPVDIGGGDKIQVGVGVHNSIDGSMGLSVGGFTFRNACANMVFMGFKGHEMGFDDRRTVAWVYHKHTKGIETIVQDLGKNIKAVVAKTFETLEMYRRWQNEKVQRETVERVMRSLPNKYLPEPIRPKRGQTDFQIPETYLAETSMWEMYNDMTAAIWHNDKSDYSTKRLQFNNLHSAMVPRVVA